MRFGKWIAGGIGWATAGPIGALVGFALGSIFDSAMGQEIEVADSTRSRTTYSRRNQTGTGDFASALLVLTAAVMKADGKVVRSELDYVRRFFTANFGEARSATMVRTLRDVLKQDVKVRPVCLQIRANMPHPQRIQLLDFLFGIAKADGHVDQSELVLLRTIAMYLGISSYDFGTQRAMHQKPTAKSDYQVLGVPSSATDDEVKKAYRKLAKKHHPDKVASLGEEIQQAAQEKFQKIQRAYDNISKSRGM